MLTASSISSALISDITNYPNNATTTFISAEPYILFSITPEIIEWELFWTTSKMDMLVFVIISLSFISLHFPVMNRA